MNASKVILIEDLPIHTDFKPKREEEVKIPTETSNYDPKFLPEEFLRKDLKPLQVVQPEGPSFTVEGNEIQWQLWNFRIRYTHRISSQLHHSILQKNVASTTVKGWFCTMCRTKMVTRLDHFSTEYLYLKWLFHTRILDHHFTEKV